MFNLRFEADALAKKLSFSQQQTHKLMAVTLTQAAYNVQKEIQAEMQRVFDRPTPFVLRSVYVRQAKVLGDSVAPAIVGIRGSTGGKVSPAHALYAEVAGGVRRRKASESMFTRMRLPGASTLGYWAPGSGAPRDQYGNIPGKTIRGILSALQLWEKQGATSAQGNAGIKGTTGLTRAQVAKINALRSERQKGDEDLAKREIARIRAMRALGNAKSQVANYFMSSGKGGKSPTVFSFDWQQKPGKRRPNNPNPAPVWVKTNLKPVLNFTGPQTYRPRLPIGDIAKRVASQDLQAILNTQALRLFAKWNQ